MWRAALIIALIVVLNVVPRLVELPSIELPSIDVPGWLEWLNRIKNVILLGLLALVVAGGIVTEARKRR